MHLKKKKKKNSSKIILLNVNLSTTSDILGNTLTALELSFYLH